MLRNSEKLRLLLETIQDMAKEPLQLTESDLTSFYSLILPSLKEIFEYDVEESIREKRLNVCLLNRIVYQLCRRSINNSA